jgi:asparagine synthase (glutamine-hydrolysing)
VEAITGFDMPVYPKRRFQHGAMREEAMHARLGDTERTYRQAFERMYT